MANDNRTPKDVAIENRAKGILNQVKGTAEEAWGNLTDNPKAKVEGKIDRLKGRVQEGFGNLVDPDKTKGKL